MGKNGPTVIISISPQLKMGKITINSPWNGRGGKGISRVPCGGRGDYDDAGFPNAGRTTTDEVDGGLSLSLQNNKFLLVAGMATPFLLSSFFILR